MHALGALAERDDYVLCVLIRVCLRALWWHLPQCLWRPVLALWCVYQSACKVASYLLGAIVSVLKALGTRVGAQGARPGEGRGRAFYRETACTPCFVHASAAITSERRRIKDRDRHHKTFQVIADIFIFQGG